MIRVNLTEAAKLLGVSYSYAAALKKAADIKARKFEVRLLDSWWKAHPNFKASDAYRANAGREVAGN